MKIKSCICILFLVLGAVIAKGQHRTFCMDSTLTFQKIKEKLLLNSGIYSEKGKQLFTQ